MYIVTSELVGSSRGGREYPHGAYLSDRVLSKKVKWEKGSIELKDGGLDIENLHYIEKGEGKYNGFMHGLEIELALNSSCLKLNLFLLC